MIVESVSEKLDRISRKGYPTTASIEVTARCNASCPYCYVKNNSAQDLSTNDLCKAIDKLSKGGVFRLHITGGEPFLRPDILNIFSYAMDHGIFHCTLFSNGINLSEKHFDFLIKYRDFFKHMQMSVFSHDVKKNDAYFGVPGALDLIMKNGLFLIKNGIQVTFALSIFDFNIDELEKTRSFFEERGFRVLLSFFKIITNDHVKRHVANSITKSFFKKYFQNMRVDDFDKLKKAMKQSLDAPPDKKASLCFGRWNSIFMDAKGNLAPCISFRNMKFGNVFEDGSLNDILLRTPGYHAVCACQRADFNKCLCCKFYNFCSICLGVIHTETQTLSSVDDQMCNFAEAFYDLI